MKSLLLAFTAVLAPLSATAGPKVIGTNGPVHLCRSAADMDQFIRYVKAGDDIAAVTFFERRTSKTEPYGACWTEEKGGFFTVADHMRGTVVMMECLRPSGLNFCAWSVALSDQRYDQ